MKKVRHREEFENNPVQSFRICYVVLQTLSVSVCLPCYFMNHVLCIPNAWPGAWHIVGTQHSWTEPAMW